MYLGRDITPHTILLPFSSASGTHKQMPIPEHRCEKDSWIINHITIPLYWSGNETMQIISNQRDQGAVSKMGISVLFDSYYHGYSMTHYWLFIITPTTKRKYLSIQNVGQAELQTGYRGQPKLGQTWCGTPMIPIPSLKLLGYKPGFFNLVKIFHVNKQIYDLR